MANLTPNPFALTSITSMRGHYQDNLKQIAATSAGNEVVKALLSGSIHIGEYNFYAARAAKADTTIELMQASDTQKVGITNVNNRKLASNNYMLVGAIQILEASVTGTDPITDAQIIKASFGKISACTANGEFELKQGTKILFQRQSNEIFKTSEGAAKRLAGYIILETPKMLLPDTEIIPSLFLPEANPRAVYKIMFHGVKN